MNRQDLKTIAEQVAASQSQYKRKVCVCCGASCLTSGSENVLKTLQAQVKEKGKEHEIQVVPSGVLDFREDRAR